MFNILLFDQKLENQLQEDGWGGDEGMEEGGGGGLVLPLIFLYIIEQITQPKPFPSMTIGCKSCTLAVRLDFG